MIINNEEVKLKVRRPRRKVYYALYKGEEPLYTGTAEELAKYLGVNVRTIYFYSTPTYRKRNNGTNAYIVIRIEEGD